MIDIKDKHDCCGCEACAQICPKHCITMKSDHEGFAYPEVDRQKCVDCGLCERVCPMHDKPLHSVVPIQTLAAINTDEDVRYKSSSGGLFSMFAERTIQHGGVVFGAEYDTDWTVVHAKAETLKELSRFRGSKYMQSRIGSTFREVKRILQSGREVLFSGTPCQVAGLKKFLGKEYANLLTVDCVCHGVPSPTVWQSYLKSVSKNTKDVSAVNMRCKSHGWKSYRMKIVGRNGEVLVDEPFDCNPFMKAFLRDMILRPACYSCPFKEGRAGSDITLGDFWGIEHIDPSVDDDRGTSLLLVNTDLGKSTIKTLGAATKSEPYTDVVSHNPSICHVTSKNRYRKLFMQLVVTKEFSTAYYRVFGKFLIYKFYRRFWLIFCS